MCCEVKKIKPPDKRFPRPNHVARNSEILRFCTRMGQPAPGQNTRSDDGRRCTSTLGESVLFRPYCPHRPQMGITKVLPTRAKEISIQHLMHRRLALRPACGADDAAASHPMRKLRQLGSIVADPDRSGTRRVTLRMLDELVIPLSSTVRLHDVEGRMLSVGRDVPELYPLTSRVSEFDSLSDGIPFLVKILHDRPILSNSTHTLTGDIASGTPCWQRYATAVALYIALADAGYCDQALPFFSIQRTNWKEFLRNQMHLRLDLMSNSTTRIMLRSQFGEHGTEGVPVALLHDIEMKGTLRRPFIERSIPSLTTRPFSDAEVFQLFYLQLVFRNVCDVRFPGMLSCDDDILLRSDLIGAQMCEKQPLAFEHPSYPDRWLLFPVRSRILHFVSLEEAIIPHYTSPERLCETAKQRLFGATPRLPCQGKVGRLVVLGWAVDRVIESPKEASVALEELFALFDETYGVPRTVVWQAPVVPRIYRCGNISLARLWRRNDDMSVFFARPPPQFFNPMACVRKECLPGGSHPEREWKGEEEDRLLRCWQQYIRDGNLTVFDGATDGIEVVRFLGSGGSSLVYEGRYGTERLPVAVKCLIIPDGMDTNSYIRESLTNVAFLVLFNQMESCNILRGTHIYDFVVSSTPPNGMPDDDVRICSSKAATELPVKLCYLVTGLMDGVVGRFLTEEDSDFDPGYDTLVNTPLRDGEVFQFLYTQLVLRTLFDCIIMDIMLHGQLRGDNLGYSFVARRRTDVSLLHPSYEGIIVCFQSKLAASPRYLRFSSDTQNADDLGPLRFICFIDLGQGMQPELQELVRRGLIGETVVESCIQDDGLGRYWPPNQLYSKYIETCGAVACKVIEWGANLTINSPQTAEEALEELFELYFPAYGVEPPTAAELATHAVLEWTPATVRELQHCCVFRDSRS